MDGHFKLQLENVIIQIGPRDKQLSFGNNGGSTGATSHENETDKHPFFDLE